MNVNEVIKNRRSVRTYSTQPVSRENIEALLDSAVQAPSAMNNQPWAFVVIQDAALLKAYSDRAKAFLLSVIDQYPPLLKYQAALSNPGFNIFYNAGTLVIICAKQTAGLNAEEDCCLAAQNLMLSAWDKGLGSCWIGFARALLNQPAVKGELKIPETYAVVAPIILGYPQSELAAVAKNPPEIFSWKE
ncbi:MAG TPA: nitroreductase [Patescibacteria group bacterium]|nr:nitroreductase [Patescibacteria group bacterium]